MRRTLPACRSGLTVAAVVVLLSACSGSDEDSSAASSSSAAPSSSASESTGDSANSQFCTEAADIQERVGSTLTDPANSGSLGQVLQEGVDEIRAIEPPAEIASDWGAFADGLERIAVAFTDVDVTDPAARQSLAAVAAEVQQELGAASTNVENYLRDECGIGSGAPAAPTS
jgi:hypothetical protein